MTYSHLKTQIANNERIPNYYEQLVKHAQDIVMDVAMTSQSTVAASLNMSTPKFSNIYSVLKAVVSLTTADELEFTALSDGWVNK
jgi:fibrillarin-like rRNA methylase